jgi:hypothetical protein
MVEGKGSRIVMFKSTMATECLRKKIQGFSHVFRNVFFQIAYLSKCPIPHGAIESISVATSFDLVGKNGAMMQKVNVNQGTSKRDKMVRSYPEFVA